MGIGVIATIDAFSGSLEVLISRGGFPEHPYDLFADSNLRVGLLIGRAGLACLNAIPDHADGTLRAQHPLDNARIPACLAGIEERPDLIRRYFSHRSLAFFSKYISPVSHFCIGHPPANGGAGPADEPTRYTESACIGEELFRRLSSLRADTPGKVIRILQRLNWIPYYLF